MNIHGHRVDAPNATFVASPKSSGPFGTGQPDTIVIHYTGGGSAESAVRTLCDPKVKASAHVVVGRDGGLTQLVPFDTIAWHAGRSAYGEREGYNRYSLGIEIDNAGRLTRSGDGWQSWFGREYPQKEVVEGVHRNETTASFWHRYTEAQIEAVHELCTVLVRGYGIAAILGHEEIAPRRKTDPGPAFPLDRLRDRILASDRSEDGGEEEFLPLGLGPETETETETPPARSGAVTASRLNIRARPAAAAPTVAPPLPRGTRVEILDEAQGWYRVQVATRGWVAKAHVET